MEGYKVLITTSGIGSRLGELTDLTNKCLIRISNKPAISHIVESYPKTTNFVISLGHFGSHVKQYLELTYPENNFQFVEIDNYKGDGSSLGYSIYSCKEYLNEPFIFHASDTIIENYTPEKPSYNYVIGGYKENSSHYCTLNFEKEHLTKINKKGEFNFDKSYVGICGIYDHDLFFENLNKLLHNKNTELSDVNVINLMLSIKKFKVKEITDNCWFDVGNVYELNKTKKHFTCEHDILDKKDESIFFVNDYVIKFFSDEVICKNRVNRTEVLNDVVPKIVGHTKNFYKYKKVDGNLFSESVTPKTFVTFINWLKTELWGKKDQIQNKNFIDFYKTKTEKRILQYLGDTVDKEEIINGLKVPSINDILNKIDFDNISNGIGTNYHGDLILDNVIETENGFKLIDWRQDFQGDIEIGDLYYDLAKLNHNLMLNHNILSKKLYKIEDDYEKKYEVLCSSNLMECQEILFDFAKQNNLDCKKIKIITALIWINMSPLHEYPLNKFLFTFGKYKLYKELI